MKNEVYRFRQVENQYHLELLAEELNPVLPDEVRIRVESVSLNYRDLIHLRNKAGRSVDGKIPCSDGVGIVEHVGGNVTNIRIGDRVAGLFFQHWKDGPFDMNYHQTALGGSVDGMLARYVTLPATGVIHVPQFLSADEASTLPCAGLTAYYSLFHRIEVQPGQTLLTLGTGGVSLFALQFAKKHGLCVIITSQSDKKLERARELGADATINYQSVAAWDKTVLELTGKKGVDAVMELGGPGTLAKSINSIRAGGKLALIGVLTGFGPPSEGLFPLVAKNAELHGIYVGSKSAFHQMNQFITQHQIHPVIDKTFDFKEAQKAFEYLESAQHFGKVIIRMN